MAEEMLSISCDQNNPIKVLKWKVRKGSTVSIGKVLFLYINAQEENAIQHKFKSPKAGILKQIEAPEGTIVEPGKLLYWLKLCNHPTIMNDMCAECGADLRNEKCEVVASVPMIHAIPDLKVSEEQAQVIGQADNTRLLRDRKLVLLVDLDQTLIHTTNDNVPADLKDVYHFQLYGPQSPWYHTRLRPGTHKFLENIFPLFELHICTFGTRNYAHMIATFLDRDQKYFSNRILSRDECFDPTSKKANLKALFPCGDNLVCIIDDREDVWSNASNLIHVKPYHFFQHTGDINAPPGLDKQDNDNISGIDFSNLKSKIKDNQHSNGHNNTGNHEEKETKTEEKESFKNSDAVEGSNGFEKNSVTKNLDQSDVEGEKVIENVDEQNKLRVTEKNNEKLEELLDPEEDEKTKTEVTEKLDYSQPEVSTVDVAGEPDENRKDVGKEEKIKSSTEQSISNKENDEKSDKNQEKDLFHYEDPDSYLLDLECILKQIHKDFYELYDAMKAGHVPDLKEVIPMVKNRVLQGTKLCFSGLVPTHQKLEQSKPYLIAKSLGAEVTQDLEDDTTHLVAVRPGTAKVNSGKKMKNLKIVNPDWLWCCAERWEHSEEGIFPLSSKGSKNRHPPPHCSSPTHVPEHLKLSNLVLRKRTPSGRFMDTINPLMSLSLDDIADMDKEVEDILDNLDSSDEEEGRTKDTYVDNQIEDEESSSSSRSNSDMDSESPQGRKRCYNETFTDDTQDGVVNDSEDEWPSIKFRRGEHVEGLEEASDDSQNSQDPPDELSDGDWNMMGARLERDFLSEN